jgi:hypothetical protein
VRNGIQEQEQICLHHWSGGNDLVHLLGRWHGRRILQNVEGAAAQRLEGALRDDLSKHVICVGEVCGKERRERSKPFVHRPAHVLKRCLGTFRKSCRRRVHQYMLQCLLHRLGTLSSGLADECCDRNVLERSLL